MDAKVIRDIVVITLNDVVHWFSQKIEVLKSYPQKLATPKI